jgi:hypothetical protein
VPDCPLPKLAIIAQGIAARYARRQASSESAKSYAQSFHLFGHLAKIILEDEGITLNDIPKSKL